MELIQKGLVVSLVVGGAETVGYYTIKKEQGTTLLDYVTSKKRELVDINKDDDWKLKDTFYKQASKEDLINGIDPRDKTVTKVGMAIKKWCTSARSKVFTDHNDDTYQKFSIWCLVTKTLNSVFTNENFEEVKDWKTKAEEFNSKDNTNSSFIQPKPAKGEKKNIEGQDIQKGCEEAKKKHFNHEADLDYIRTKKGCFKEPKANG